MNRFAFILIITFLIGCRNSAVDSHVAIEPKPESQDAIAAIDIDDSAPWAGIYVSINEIAGFSGTAMSLGPVENGQRKYRKHFYSCISMHRPELSPIIETNGRELTITERYEFRTPDGTLHDPLEHTSKYTRLKLNDHIVLLRDDALKQFELNNKIYDYGVLVKISDDHASFDDLAKAPHPSIRTLYENPDAGWDDPFVHGANSRK